MMLSFLANAALDTGKLGMGSQGSVWQALGGMAVVFGLLLLFLKLLGKLNKKGAAADTSVVAVWPLGPKREIQVLRLGDMVHYIYRHEGSMVVLKEESHEQFLASHEQGKPNDQGLVPWKKILGGRMPFLQPQSNV